MRLTSPVQLSGQGPTSQKSHTDKHMMFPSTVDKEYDDIICCYNVTLIQQYDPGDSDSTSNTIVPIVT